MQRATRPSIELDAGKLAQGVLRRTGAACSRLTRHTLDAALDETHHLIARGPRLPELPTVGTDLRAVIPVAGEDLGGGVRLISIEIYDKGMVVRVLASPPPDDFHSLTGRKAFALSDDAGTRYRYFSGGAQGRGDATRVEANYVPAPPDGARVLAVSYHDQSVSVQLP